MSSASTTGSSSISSACGTGRATTASTRPTNRRGNGDDLPRIGRDDRVLVQIVEFAACGGTDALRAKFWSGHGGCLMSRNEVRGRYRQAGFLSIANRQMNGRTRALPRPPSVLGAAPSSPCAADVAHDLAPQTQKSGCPIVGASRLRQICLARSLSGVSRVRPARSRRSAQRPPFARPERPRPRAGRQVDLASLDDLRPAHHRRDPGRRSARRRRRAGAPRGLPHARRHDDAGRRGRLARARRRRRRPDRRRPACSTSAMPAPDRA